MTKETREEAGNAEQVEALLATKDLADALESEPFRRFLDQVPIAIIISRMLDPERIVYANPEFEKLSGQTASQILGQAWSALKGESHVDSPARQLGEAIAESSDFVATFKIERAGEESAIVDAYAHGLEVFLPTDAVASDSPDHGVMTIEWLDGRAAHCLPTDKILERLRDGTP